MRGSNKLLSVEFQPDRSGLAQSTDPRCQLLVAEGRDQNRMSDPSEISVSILAPRCRGARPAVAATEGPLRQAVSILAPRCRGARRLAKSQPSSHQTYVSILAPRCRGARPAWHRHSEIRQVSILAPRCRGARRSPCRRSFQSSPLVAEGRDRRENSSLPTFATGQRCIAGRCEGHTNSRRSVPTSPSLPKGASPTDPRCFNPRPSLPRGATNTACPIHRMSRFNPRPSLPRGATQQRTSVQRQTPAGFNPRPSLPRGATEYAWMS